MVLIVLRVMIKPSGVIMVSCNKSFFEYILNGKSIIFHKKNVILIQVGKGKQTYKTRYSFTANEFSNCVMLYNGINIGNGYKKRLVCNELNKPLLARVIS